jgi:hypothetical protein
MTIVITIVKVRMVAAARNPTTVVPGVGGRKDVTGTATTKERTKDTVVNAAASRVNAAASRVDAALNRAAAAVSTAAAVDMVEAVNPEPEASTVAVSTAARVATAAANPAAGIQEENPAAGTHPVRAAITKAAAGKTTAAMDAAIVRTNETT